MSRASVRATPDVLNVPTWWMVLLVSVLAIAGVSAIRSTPLWRTLGFLIVPYLIVVVGHPYPMIRYLVPLVPIVAIFAAAGFDRLIRHSVPLLAGDSWHELTRLTALIGIAMWIGANLMWIARFPAVTHHSIHGGFGRAISFDWRGFEQTFAWVRQQTRPDARLATAYGSLYYAFTGRKAVRPWFHEPDLYEPDYGIGHYSCQDAPAIHDDLRRLSIDYLIIDPQLNDLDSAYGTSCLSKLLSDYGSEFVLEFTSTNGNHRVYRLVTPTVGPASEPRTDRRLHPAGTSGGRDPDAFQ